MGRRNTVKYLYSRKQIINMWGDGIPTSIEKDLLAKQYKPLGYVCGHNKKPEDCEICSPPKEVLKVPEKIEILKESGNYWMDSEFQMGKCELIISKKINSIIDYLEKIKL